MVALGVRRNIQIGPEQFDFDQTGLEEDDLAHERDRSEVYDSATKRALNKIMVAQCELAVAMTSTMTTAYCNEQSLQPDGLTITSLISCMAEIERANTQLLAWARRFRIVLDAYSDTGEQQPQYHQSVILFAHMTMIHYLYCIIH